MQQIDALMHSRIANLSYARYGRRDMQEQCGAGQHNNNRTTGGTAEHGMTDTIGYDEAYAINNKITNSLIDGLVHQTVNQRIRDFVVDGIRFIVADGVCHPMLCRSACCAVVVVLSGTALLLHVPAPVPCIAQIRNAAVHQRIYLLHAPLLAVVVEVDVYKRQGSC